MLYGGSGPPATLVRELGQVRKEAATADDVCAGMWLGLPPICSQQNQLASSLIQSVSIDDIFLLVITKVLSLLYG